MSARDELVEILHQTATADRVKNAPLREVPIVAAKVEAVAAAILAAGYRKPGVIEPENMRIENGYLVAEVKGCTCGGGGPKCNYAHENGCGLEPLADITGALERSGYRKPRTITTEAEVDALPDGAVAMTCYGDALTIRQDVRDLRKTAYRHLVKHGPATVLWEPSDG